MDVAIHHLMLIGNASLSPKEGVENKLQSSKIKHILSAHELKTEWLLKSGHNDTLIDVRGALHPHATPVALYPPLNTLYLNHFERLVIACMSVF